MARHEKPFSYGQYIKEAFPTVADSPSSDMKCKAGIMKSIEELPLSKDTFRGRVVDMASDIKNQPTDDLGL